MRKICLVVCFLMITLQVLAVDFGYIGYSTNNIGDDIQALAAKQFLPKSSTSIDRDFISKFHHNSKICVIVNGWYMHTDRFSGKHQKKEYNWPPSDVIDPLLISMHFTMPFVSAALSPQSVEYLINHGPVGARDYFTLRMLQSRNIPSYFSGCLTLTLTNTSKEKENIVYAVDLDEECVNFLRSKTSFPVEAVTHQISHQLAANPEARLKYAEELLDKYKKARYVVTRRLHAAMPCLALETPVLLIDIQSDQYRFNGLQELVRHCDRETFLQGSMDFDLNNPRENPNTYLPIRKNLINTIKSWVASKSGLK